MIPRAALLVSVLQLALTSFGQIPQGRPLSRGGGATVKPLVLEAQAKASLQKNTIRITPPLRSLLLKASS
jgi:hypothetical protein